MSATVIRLTPGHGQADAAARANIPAGYTEKLLNFYARGQSWVQRLGAQKLHATAYAYQLAGCWALKLGTASIPTGTPGRWNLMAATQGTAANRAHFLLKIGAALVQIPYNGTGGPDYDATDAWRSWRATAVNDTTMYACRRTVRGGWLYNLKPAVVTDCALTAPPAPTVTNAAVASTLPAGTYQCAYRYLTNDGQVSPMSPVTAVTCLAGDQRQWSGLTASTHPRVISKELFLSYANGDSENLYYFTTLANATLTLNEATLDSAYDIATPANFALGTVPNNPEDCDVFDGRLWLVSNDPEPLIWPCAIEGGDPLWESFDPTEALKLPAAGGQRYMAFRRWDRLRAAAFADASAFVITPGAGSSYQIADLSTHHGAVSAAAVAVGEGGILAFFDGRHLLSSQGGPAEIVSRGWVDKALSNVPQAYADRAVLSYSPRDGGIFILCIPSTSSSTANDLALGWNPRTGEWCSLGWMWTGSAHRAPNFIGQAPPEDSDGGAWPVLCTFADQPRIHQLDADVRRDEGPINVHAQIISAAVPIPEGYELCAVSRVALGVRRRSDTSVPDPSVASTGYVRLLLDGVDATAVQSVTIQGEGPIYARAQNLGDPRAIVQVIFTSDHPDVLEVYDMRVWARFFRRKAVRV